MRELAGLAAVVGWFVFLAHRALGFGFNPDDEMLMHFAISRSLKLNIESVPFFWNGYIRPLGTIFYLVIYRVFGYWSPPYRIGAFALIAINIVLLYRFAKAMTGSVTAAFLVALAGCFHREIWEIYSSTGTIFDILCQSFILLALTFWVNQRGPESWRSVAVIFILTIGAVDSKEMGVAIPVLLLLYDLLFRRKSIRYIGIAATGAVVAIFLLGRFAQPTAVTGNPAFTPIITFSHYLLTTQLYLNFLLLKPGLSELGAVIILVTACAVAVILRNRLMLFGLAFYVVTLLPMSFAMARSGYALYVPQTGALLFAAGLLLQAKLSRPVMAGLLVAGIMTSQLLGSYTLAATHAAPGYLPQVEAFTNGMRRAFPRLAPGTTLTVVNDPLPDLYVPWYTVEALYDDPSLKVTRVVWDPAKGTEQLGDSRNTLFFSGLHSWRFGSLDESGQPIDGRPREAISMSSPLAAWNIVADVAGEPTAEGSRWAFADPQFVFSRPAGASEFVLQYDVPGAVTDQTGPLRLNFEVDGKTSEHVVIEKPSQCQYVTSVSGHGNPLVRVKIHAENPWHGANGEKLSFLVTWAGLRKTQ